MLHPLAWWAWALGLGVAATRTTHPVVALLVVLAALAVVAAGRPDARRRRAFRGYLVLGAAIVVLRVVFYVAVGIKTPGLVLVDLPRVALPAWAVGVHLLGPVTLTGVLMAVYGGLRLAALVVCFGAANTLADPRRALRSLPASLHQVGTAVVVAVSVAPQLVQASADVRRAQRLRGVEVRGARAVARTAVPVLTDALDRSLVLAASMDVRGYARAVPGHSDAGVTALALTALLAGALGTYGLLDGTTPGWLGVPVLLAGLAAAVGASVLAGRRVRRTRYRPDPWRWSETAVAAAGVAAGALLVLVTATDPSAVDPSLSPLRWPTVAPSVLVAGLLAAAPLLVPAARAPREGRGADVATGAAEDDVDRDAARRAAGVTA